MKSSLLRFLRTLPLLVVLPVVIALCAIALAVTDFLWMVFGRRHRVDNTKPDTRAASLVIPNWNGRDLLAKYIPPLLDALAANPANEIVVVDNGSEDGSAEFLSKHFPSVIVLALDRNLGFGGGSNLRPGRRERRCLQFACPWARGDGA